MNKLIQIEARNQYGQIVYHPANDVARALARIANTKTLTAETLAVAQHDLGFVVEQVVPKFEAWGNRGGA